MTEPMLHDLTVADAARRIAACTLSPVEYTKALLARIESLDGQVNAFVTLTPERALAAARAAEHDIAAGRHRGPLHGIPYALKDVFDTANVRTTGGSRLYSDNVPKANAAAVQRLEDAGAILLGKLATHELASGGPSLDLPSPPARNPWNTAHFTGGSSSGPGAAVAAGFVPLALGSDTGGSIRIPAALCGVAGFKPTYGLVSRLGVMPNSWTFDHVGPLAWTVEDCALAMQALAGADAGDPASPPRPAIDFNAALEGGLRGLRVGVVRHFWEEEGRTDPQMAAAMAEALDLMRAEGAVLADARMRTRQAYSDVMMVIAKTETAAAYRPHFQRSLGAFGSDYIARTLPGLFFSGEDYVRAQRERQRMVAGMTALYERFDVLVTATSTPAPVLQAVIGAGAVIRWQDPSLYTPFNVTAGPALVLCNGYAPGGLPLAMQLAGRPFDDATVLRAGRGYEAATQWRARRPDLHAGARPVALHPASQDAREPPDAQTRGIVDASLRRAGITVSDAQRDELYRIAVPALAAAARIAGEHATSDEPASRFCL